jgi:hypothetical protein
MQAVHSLHEQNPMLGLRGVRLGLVVPGLFDLQVRAIAEATAQLIKLGKNPQPEIMIPLVGSVQELEIIRADSVKVLAEVAQESGVDFPALIGTMIELPRAAMTAGQIAEAAEFFSFGTNDLTQTTWGFSRDDVEAAFFSTYLEMGIFGDQSLRDPRHRRVRRRAQVCGGQDAADGASADVVTEAGELALDAAVSPARVLPCQPDDELTELAVDGRTSRPARVGPLLGEQAAVPGQEGGGCDESMPAQLVGQEPG